MTTGIAQLGQTLAREKTRFMRYVRKRLLRVSVMDAEDIVSDMILGLIRRADVFGEIENHIAYAYRTLENKIIDFRRGERDTVALDAKENQDRLPPGFPDSGSAEGGAASLELRERLIQAVDQLSPGERAVWIATEIDGRSFRDLSEEWDEPLGTLLSRKSRANARLRGLLKDYKS